MFFNKVHIRIRYIFLFVLIIFIIIMARVFYIEVIDYNKLKTLSDDLYARNLPIKADRGEILDRNGKVLATNVTSTFLAVIPRQISNKEETATKLADILGASYDAIYKHLSKNTSIEIVNPEGRNLSYDIAEQIENLNIDGLYLIKESKRYYPYGTLLSHTLGYVGVDNQGLSGIEYEYDDILKGTDGSIKYYSDGKGNKLPIASTYNSATDGNSITLTIDIDIQKAVESELDNIISKYDADNALIVVEDPQSGEILAMASRPTFDSNNYQSASQEVINRNLPIWMTYEPGSTFKIVTLASAIEEKAIDVFKDTYYDSGSINVDGSTLHCWKSGGHGAQTYLNVVENSCNPGFVSIGLKLGKEKLMSYIKNFGFGEKTGIDLNGESTGILFDESKMGLVELATTSFGQGISVTPIQQVNAVSSIINGGNLYKPYIVKSILDQNTNTILKTNEKTLVRKVISEDTSSLVRYVLESVVANGTGKNAYIENYRVGGKTGTAQKVVNGKYSSTSYILSFMGFLPADNPQAVVYVAIDGAKNVTQYGGTASAPVAKNVMQSVITALNISPSSEGMPKKYTYLDTKYIMVPDVTGKNISDAQNDLKDFNVIYSGSGEKIIYQSPESGMYIKEGEDITLMLGD